MASRDMMGASSKRTICQLQLKWQVAYQDDASLEKVMVIYSPINGLQEVDSAKAAEGLERDVHNNVIHQALHKLHLKAAGEHQYKLLQAFTCTQKSMGLNTFSL